MSALLTLSELLYRVERTALSILALFGLLTANLFGSAVMVHAKSSSPDKPEGLVYASEEAEVSAPDMEAITSLMDGLNDAHEEQVGIIITSEAGEAQKLADAALKDWGLAGNGGIIVITTADQDVGVAVGSRLEKDVPSEARNDVANKVSEGLGEYRDWGKGIQIGATRLFFYIEGQGLGGGTDVHHGDDGHSHKDGDPAVEEVPAGEVPDDAYIEESEASPGRGVNTATKIVGGITIALLAITGIFLLFREDNPGKER